MDDDDKIYTILRDEMVERQIVARGVNNPLVIKAMRTIPRHLFVAPRVMKHAYEDSPMDIGEGQTISQPYIVALMIEVAQCDSSSVVLEIGTGSGYAAAVFSLVAKEVYTIERIKELAEIAELRYKKFGYENIHVKVGDGTLGWQEKGPFDAIVVTAGSPEVPHSLLSQLKVGGRLVVPVGDALSQRLMRIRRVGAGAGEGDFKKEYLAEVRFVPLIGKEGWHVPGMDE